MGLQTCVCESGMLWTWAAVVNTLAASSTLCKLCQNKRTLPRLQVHLKTCYATLAAHVPNVKEPSGLCLTFVTISDDSTQQLHPLHGPSFKYILSLDKSCSRYIRCSRRLTYCYQVFQQSYSASPWLPTSSSKSMISDVMFPQPHPVSKCLTAAKTLVLPTTPPLVWRAVPIKLMYPHVTKCTKTIVTVDSEP